MICVPSLNGPKDKSLFPSEEFSSGEKTKLPSKYEPSGQYIGSAGTKLSSLISTIQAISSTSGFETMISIISLGVG